MLSGNGLEVGSVFARIGALFDDDGFDKFRRAMRDVRDEADKEVKPDLEADFNSRGFDQFDKALTGARTASAKDVKPDLGADFSGRGFDQFERALTGARTDATRDVTTDLKADVDKRGFSEYDRALRSARNESDITTRAGVRTGNGFVSVGKSAAGAAVAFLGTYGLVEGVRALYSAYRDSEKVGAQTEAVLRSTGEEANVSADKVGRLAEKYSELAAMDDEAIQEGENFLLTFTNIRNEVGRGNNIFDQATLAVLNMSVALGQDMKSGALQLGKALNDPIKGITALSRVGVAFTEETKERIETLVEQGDVLEAQKIILRELNTEFGGSAKAAGRGASGFERLGIAVENAQEKIGSKLAPTLSRWSTAAADFIGSLTKGDIRTSKFGRTLDNFYRRHKDTFRAIGSGAREFGQAVVIAVDRAGDAIRWLGPYWRRAFDGISTFLKGWATLFRGAMKIISGILTGDLGRAVDGVRDLFEGLVGMVKGAVLAMLAPFRFAWDKVEGLLVQPIKDGIDKALGLLSGFIGRLGDVSGFVSGIPGVGEAFDGVSDSINDAQDSIDRYRESLRKTEDEHGNAVKAAKRQVEALKSERAQLRLNNASHDQLRRNKRALRNAQDDLTTATRKTGDGMKRASGNARGWGSSLRNLTTRTKSAKDGTAGLHREVRDQGPSGAFSKGLKRMIRGAGNFQGALGRAVEYVKEATNKALSGFGAKPMDWIVQAAKDVGDLLGFARGGFIGRRGQKGKDKRLVLAGDGEAFFNGDQIPYVEQALRKTYGVNLGQFFSGRRWRPHSQTRGYEEGGVVGFARGGFVDPPGPGTGVVNPAIADVVGQWSRRYNAAINYGYDPGGGHKSPGHNVTGTATDTGPAAGWTGSATALFEQGLRAIEGKVDQILYGTAGIGESYPNHGRGNHAHIEWGLNPRGIGAARIPKLTIRGPKGPQRAILQGAADMMVKRANSYLDSQASPVGMIAGDVGPGTLSDAEFLSLARQALELTGHGGLAGGARKLLILAEQESGLDPNSINNWDSNAKAGNPSGGLMHTTEDTFEAYHEPGTANTYFDPLASIAASINYQFDRYGGLVTHSPYAEGGLVESFAGGGVVGGGGKGGKKNKGGGKGKPPDVGIAEPAGPIHVASMGPLEAHLGADGGKFVAFQERRLGDLEADYSYWERRFNLSEEEFIVEGPNGEPSLNREAIKRRVGELKKLLSIRQKIIAVRNREIAFAKKTIELMRPVIKALKQGLRAARSQEARRKWREAVDKYTGMMSNWKGQLGGWQTDKRERITDRDEVLGQLKALAPGGTVENEFEDALADFNAGLGGGEGDLGGEGDAGEAGGEAPPGEPTPEQIAEAARAQLSEFQAQRASLYGEFGSNFVPGGTVPFATRQQQAAGMAFYGAAGSQAPTVPALVAAAQGGGAGVEINLEQTFQAPPPDAHTWTKSVLFELGAQL